MKPIRVLVVDDSVVARKVIADALQEHPEVEIAGVAANGRIGLARIQQMQPDLVTLDLEMPVMDGLATLKELRKMHPTLPVIVFSSRDDRAAKVTIEALALGADDYIAKPRAEKLSDAGAYIRAQLLPRVIALCGRVPTTATTPARNIQLATSISQAVRVVVVGVSTGGPNALAEFVPSLPRLPVPMLIVQHMPPVFTTYLAERLTTNSTMPVHEGQHGTGIAAGEIWLAPGGHHMAVERRESAYRLVIHDGPLENSCRPAADVLFRSAVSAYGAGVLAVVLTGMGQDGLHGSRLIQEAGGQVIVQDEATSVVWGMPGFIAKQGLANKVLPLKEIAGEVRNRVGVVIDHSIGDRARA